jgi:hypothetical protein
MLFANELAKMMGIDAESLPCVVSFEASDIYNSCLQRLTCDQLLGGAIFNENLDDDNQSWECYLNLGIICDINWTRDQGYILDYRAARVTIEKPSAAHAAAFVFGMFSPPY